MARTVDASVTVGRPRSGFGYRFGQYRGRIVLHTVLCLSLLVFLLPIIWSISASFKGKEELFATLPSLLPMSPTLQNYNYVVKRIGEFPLYFVNSLIVTTGTVATIVLCSSLAGYAFGRLRFKARDLIFYTLVMQIFIPRAGGLDLHHAPDVLQYSGRVRGRRADRRCEPLAGVLEGDRADGYGRDDSGRHLHVHQRVGRVPGHA